MKTKFFALLLFLLPQVLLADPNQLMGEQEESLDSVEKNYKRIQSDDTFISSGVGAEQSPIEKNYQNVNVENPFVQDQTVERILDDEHYAKKGKDKGVRVLGSMDNEQNYIEADRVEFRSRLNNKGRYALKLSYLFMDRVSYDNPGQTYDRTFKEGPKHFKSGLLLLGYEKYFNRKFIDFFWGINVGANFSRGSGVFSSDKSRTTDAYINLWTFPLDFAGGLSIPLTTWASVSGSAGPSLLWIWQTRSDRVDGEPGKRRRQSSLGFFADAQFRFNLTNTFPSTSYKLYDTYNVTKLWLNVESRYQQYSNFQQAGIKVSGTSLGASFTFEYF